MSTVELKGIRKLYGSVEAIRGLDLSVAEGEFCALLGPSGCGKSTLLRIIAGLEAVTQGSVWIGGTDVTSLPPSKRRIAMVFQSYALYPHMSVRENIGFSLRVARVPKADAAKRILHVAQLLRLSEMLDRKPAQLSGGQRQRVAIGRALVRDPEVFLFDEPLSNLDAMLRTQMRVEIAKLHRDLGRTMIYVTHDQVEAMTLASKIVVLDRGVISQVGSPLELYDHPANKFVASFIGSPTMNFIAVDAVGDDMIAMPDGRRMTLPEGKRRLSKGKFEIGVRPEHIRLTAYDDPTASFTGKVDLLERLGNATIVYVESSAGRVLIQSEGDVVANVGDNVGLVFQTDRIHIFPATEQRPVQAAA
jgi:multiple sugar transport system ATP-binding protein